jgi:hypothetical protein
MAIIRCEKYVKVNSPAKKRKNTPLVMVREFLEEKKEMGFVLDCIRTMMMTTYALGEKNKCVQIYKINKCDFKPGEKVENNPSWSQANLFGHFFGTKTMIPNPFDVIYLRKGFSAAYPLTNSYVCVYTLEIP